MTSQIGIRREDKNRWERRVPLTPEAVARLVGRGIDVVVQPSDVRVFPDDEYAAAGARVADDLSGCGVVFAVKEIPPGLLRADTAYVFFSHTVKGQAHNMTLLRRVLDVGATLVDYERVVDPDGRRLIHFGRYAGLAGTIDALWALGRRYAEQGLATPLSGLRPAWAYESLASALTAVQRCGEAIREQGMPREAAPLVIGVVGYGNVAGGAQEVLDHLGVRDVDPDELAGIPPDGHDVIRVTFAEGHTVAHPTGDFDLQAYREHPDRFESVFAGYLPRLSLLINAIHWDARAPRLVSRKDLQQHADRLAVIADLSCDIDGGIEATVRATTPDDPVYVYDPARATSTDGVVGTGVVVLAVDHLPCELPWDASVSFSEALEPWVPVLAEALPHGLGPVSQGLGLPAEWAGAVIAHHGALMPAYESLAASLATEEPAAGRSEAGRPS